MGVRAGSRSLATMSQWAAGHWCVTMSSRVSSGRVAMVSHWVYDTATQGYKRGRRAVGPAPWRSVWTTNAGMSSCMAVATKEQLASMRQTKMDFWDGMEHTFMMPSITAKGTGSHSHHRSVVRTNSRSIVWVRLSTAAISGLYPCGAGDSSDTLHLPMRHSSGGVGGLRAGRHRARPDSPLLSRANSRLGRGGWLCPKPALAAQGGSTPASSSSPQRSGESPWPWSMACSYFSPPQKAGNPPQKSPLRD